MRWAHLLAKLPQVEPGWGVERWWFGLPRQGAAVADVGGV